MSKNLKAHLAVLATNLFFAANFSFVKLISPELVPPFGLNIFRVGISLTLFWIVWSMGRSPAGIQRKHWLRIFLCALCGVAINQMLFIKGLTLTTTVHASLLMLTTPLFITVFALFVLKEKLTWVKALGLLLGVGGALMLVLGRESGSSTESSFLGDILIFINAISYSLYFILVRPLMQIYSPLHIVRWMFTIGFFLILPFGWQEAVSVDFSLFDTSHWLAFSAVIFTGTFLAYYFNAFGIQVLGAGTTGSYIYTQPVFAVIIATLILHETISIQKFLAACFIFSGVYLVSRKT